MSLTKIVDNYTFSSARNAIPSLISVIASESKPNEGTPKSRKAIREALNDLWKIGDQLEGVLSKLEALNTDDQPQKINGASVVSDYEDEDEGLGDRAQDGSIG